MTDDRAEFGPAISDYALIGDCRSAALIFGLNYGRRTPLTTMLGQMVYGATLGGLCQMADFFAGAPG